MPARRTVILCSNVSRARGSKERLWAFGLADLAHALGTTETALAARLRRGICRAWAAENRIDIITDALTELRDLPRKP